MKALFASLFLVALSGCLSTRPEVQIPTIWSDLQASLAGDKLVLRYRMYESVRGELDLRVAGKFNTRSDTNTALYERFAGYNAAEELPGIRIPLEIEYVTITTDGQRTFVTDSTGREIQPAHDHIALLNHRESVDYFGYAFLRIDRPPVVFFVKPQIFASKTKVAIPVPVGWKD